MDELEGAWSFLTLTEEERDTVVTTSLSADSDPSVQAKWMVGKLITKRLFQKDSMMTYNVQERLEIVQASGNIDDG